MLEYPTIPGGGEEICGYAAISVRDPDVWRFSPLAIAYTPMNRSAYTAFQASWTRSKSPMLVGGAESKLIALS